MATPASRKFIRFYLTSNTKLFLGCIVILLFSLRVGAQTDDPFGRRLSDIRLQLDMLSDSISPGLNEMTNFSVSGLSIQTFLRTLAESHNLNIQVDPALTVLLTNNFTSVPAKDIIYFLCQEYGLDVRFVGSILSFTKYAEPKSEPLKPVAHKLNIGYDASSGKVTFDFRNDSLKAVVKEITRLSDRNVVALGGLDMENKLISGYIKDMPLESAIDKLAYINGLRLNRTKDGVLIVESNQPSNTPGTMNASQGNAMSFPRNMQGDITITDSLITLDVVNFPILELIHQTSNQLGINYILFSDIAGNTTAKVKRVRYEELLSFLFQGTSYTFKKKDGVYLLGQRTQEGFRSSELVKLQFRTIEGVEKEIPTELLKDIELRVLRELNAFILTGNKSRIDELVTFIHLIDQPIPNILIEVIVAEANKTFSLETGIKAFISPDSMPKTSGQIFPGLDLTLSSRSVNNVLESLNSNGIANLGKVSPNFYTTLKALETNENIQIRSTPKLSTMNGNKANLTIGKTQYYLEQTQNITGGVSPVQSISQHFNKVEANLSITISPVVSGNEHITLDIVAEFSSFNAPTIPNAPPGNTTRKFESKIRVKNEEVIILGGLETVSKTDGGSGVPLLSKIPVLKWFFSSRTKKKDDNRLIVFIRPTLVY